MSAHVRFLVLCITGVWFLVLCITLTSSHSYLTTARVCLKRMLFSVGPPFLFVTSPSTYFLFIGIDALFVGIDARVATPLPPWGGGLMAVCAQHRVCVLVGPHLCGNRSSMRNTVLCYLKGEISYLNLGKAFPKHEIHSQDSKRWSALNIFPYEIRRSIGRGAYTAAVLV